MITLRNLIRCCSLLIGLLVGHNVLLGQGLKVTGHVTLVTSSSQGKPGDSSNAVVWLTALHPTSESFEDRNAVVAGRYRLVQKNKRFTPHILVVPVGAMVEFPNYDPFFHNVFSLFDGKRFDLGLYEAGTTRKIAFNLPGVSYIFCNIHPEMSAVIVALKAALYDISNPAGDVSINNVPAGRYQLNVWHERCSPDVLRNLTREVVVSPSSPSLGELRLPESGDILSKHKNKYGRDYDPVLPSNPIYDYQ